MNPVFKRTLLSILCLPGIFASRAFPAPLLPEEYTGEVAMFKPGTYPKSMVIKYFDAIDKGFDVEIGALQDPVYEILFNEQHQAYRFSEFTAEGDLKEQYGRTYNTNGLVTGETKRGSNRFVQYSSEYTYENPRQAKTVRAQRIYNSEKALVYIETYQSDKSGNVTSMRRTNAKNETVYAYEYSYDANNNRIRETRLDASGNRVSEQEHDYGKNNELLSDNVYNSKGKLLFHNEYEYNDKGEMSEMTVTYAGGAQEVYRMVYEYDARGNWIRQTTYKGSNIPVGVIVRVIEY